MLTSQVTRQAKISSRMPTRQLDTILVRMPMSEVPRFHGDLLPRQASRNRGRMTTRKAYRTQVGCQQS